MCRIVPKSIITTVVMANDNKLPYSRQLLRHNNFHIKNVGNQFKNAFDVAIIRR